MKTIGIKIIAGSVLAASCVLSACDQTSKGKNEDQSAPTSVADRNDQTSTKGGETSALDTADVPKRVSSAFYKDYPAIEQERWFGLPPYDYGNDYGNDDTWYDSWYDYNPYGYQKNPEYFLVKYNQDNAPHQAVYSKSGEKVAVHKKITADLPEAIATAISKSDYKTWKVESEKEEIFKDKDSDQLKVYRVNVENGTKKHALYFQPDGTLLKDQKVS